MKKKILGSKKDHDIFILEHERNNKDDISSFQALAAKTNNFDFVQRDDLDFAKTYISWVHEQQIHHVSLFIHLKHLA